MTGGCTESPPKVAERSLSHISYRHWFWPFVAGFALLMVGALIAVERGYAGQRAGFLAFFVAYMSIACTFFPLPTLPILLWISAEFDPLLVATLGALGTCAANLNDYYLLTFLLGFPTIDRVRTTRIYRLLVTWFDRAPFMALSVATFLPISVDVVRLLAISRRYSRLKFTLATFVGRWPRYIIITYIGHELKLSLLWILIIFAIVCLWGLVQIMLNRLRAS